MTQDFAPEEPTGEQDSLPALMYFADPMCSWCWGFSPVLDAVMQEFSGSLQLELIVGGLRVHPTQPLPAALREQILHSWKIIGARTGQPFHFEGALPPDYDYNTEPACRAVALVGQLAPSQQRSFLHRLQKAFYADGRDISDPQILAAVAAEQGMDKATFAELLASDQARMLVTTHFQKTKQWGVRSFPTVLLRQRSGTLRVASGYRSFEVFSSELAAALARVPGRED